MELDAEKSKTANVLVDEFGNASANLGSPTFQSAFDRMLQYQFRIHGTEKIQG